MILLESTSISLLNRSVEIDRSIIIQSVSIYNIERSHEIDNTILLLSVSMQESARNDQSAYILMSSVGASLLKSEGRIIRVK